MPSMRFISEKDILLKIKETEAKLKSIEKQKSRESVCCKCGGKRLVSGKICDCTLPYIYKECFGALDVALFKESFENSDLSLFDGTEELIKTKTQKDLFALVERKAKAFANDFPCSKTKNLLFIGGSGLGKTFLCRCIAKEIAKKAPVCYMTANSLAKVFLAHRLGEDTDLDILYDAPLLVIDDLGTESMHQNVTVEYLAELIEKRHFSEKHTVFSTNLSINDIKQRYGERISSRLSFKDIGEELRLLGKDIRRK